MKKLFPFLFFACSAIMAMTQGAWQYGGLNQGAWQNGAVPVTYDTLWCQTSTGGTVSPASRGDSSNNVNPKLFFTATVSGGYVFNTWTSKQSHCTFYSGTQTAAICTVSVSANDTIIASFTLISSPPLISYAQNFIATVAVDSSVSDAVTNSGGAVASWNSSPTLPAGLSFDASGNIVGTPTVTVTDSTLYTITATNAGGSSSFGIYFAIYTSGTLLRYASITVDTLGYIVTMVNDPSHPGTISPASGSYADTGVMQKLTFAPPAGYRLSGWTASGGAHLNAIQDSFYLSANGTLTAADTSHRWICTMAKSGGGYTIPPLGDTLVDSNSHFTVIAIPSATWDTFRIWDLTSGAGQYSDDDTSTTTLWLWANSTMTAYFDFRAPIVPSLSLPLSGDTMVPKTTTFKWFSNGVLADSAYILALSKDTFKTTLSLDTGLAPDTIKAKTLNSANCWYAWKVKGGNPGGWGAYSTVRYFRTAASSGGGGGFIGYGAGMVIAIGLGMGFLAGFRRKFP